MRSIFKKIKQGILNSLLFVGILGYGIMFRLKQVQMKNVTRGLLYILGATMCANIYSLKQDLAYYTAYEDLHDRALLDHNNKLYWLYDHQQMLASRLQYMYDKKFMHDRMMYPTVRISNAMATGTGVIISSVEQKDGSYLSRVLTAAHVISGYKIEMENGVGKIKPLDQFVEIFSTNKKYEAKIIKTNTAKDLGLMEIITPMKLHHAQLASINKDLNVFDRTFLVGCPMGIEPYASTGEIGAFFKNDSVHCIMSTAPAYFGNSGGGLYNEECELIGITSSMLFCPQLSDPVTHVIYHISIFEIHEFLKNS